MRSRLAVSHQTPSLFAVFMSAAAAALLGICVVAGPLASTAQAAQSSPDASAQINHSDSAAGAAHDAHEIADTWVLVDAVALQDQSVDETAEKNEKEPLAGSLDLQGALGLGVSLVLDPSGTYQMSLTTPAALLTPEQSATRTEQGTWQVDVSAAQLVADPKSDVLDGTHARELTYTDDDRIRTDLLGMRITLAREEDVLAGRVAGFSATACSRLDLPQYVSNPDSPVGTWLLVMRPSVTNATLGEQRILMGALYQQGNGGFTLELDADGSYRYSRDEVLTSGTWRMIGNDVVELTATDEALPTCLAFGGGMLRGSDGSGVVVFQMVEQGEAAAAEN